MNQRDRYKLNIAFKDMKKLYKQCTVNYLLNPEKWTQPKANTERSEMNNSGSVCFNNNKTFVIIASKSKKFPSVEKAQNVTLLSVNNSQEKLQHGIQDGCQRRKILLCVFFIHKYIFEIFISEICFNWNEYLSYIYNMYV